jgi:nucleoid-associated protein YgaU
MAQSKAVILLSSALGVLLTGGISAALVVSTNDSSASDEPNVPSISTPSVTPGASELPFVDTTPLPTATPAPTAATAPAVVASPTAPAPVVTTAPAPEVLTYVVKKGDNLSVIAAWFKLNGYSGLYEANKAVIGGNPDLIHPGQVFRIVDGQMQIG